MPLQGLTIFCKRKKKEIRNYTKKHATNAVFRLERSTEVLELTYLGKYFARVNAN